MKRIKRGWALRDAAPAVSRGRIGFLESAIKSRRDRNAPPIATPGTV